MKALALVLAVAFVVLAVLYFTGNAPYPHGVHVKHAVLMLVLAVASLVWFRFQSNPSSGRSR
jgi:hypothetical protein